MFNEASYYLREPDLVIVSTARQYLFVGAQGSVAEREVQDSASWSRLMQDLMVPRRGDTLRKYVEHSLTMGVPEIASLVEAGVLIQAACPDELEERRHRLYTNNQGYHLEPQEQKCGHLVVAMAGSIVAGLMAPALLSLCYSSFHAKMDLILTEAALRFVNRDLFEYYGIRTWVSAYDRRDEICVPHVALGHSADCLLVMPASASCCHRLASGASSDLLSMTVAATRSPVVAAPVMNSNMWNHKPVQRNLQQMRDDGIYVIEPTLIFGAAELQRQSDPVYGGPGTFWRGGLGVMQTLTAIMEHHQRNS